MRSVRTLSVCLFATATSAVPAQAQVELPRLFANCAGRYSAMLEHAWLMQDPRAKEYERLRAEFIALLDSVGGTNPRALDLRIEAKFAMSALLSQAEFGETLETAERATRYAQAELDTCRLMLLGG